MKHKGSTFPYARERNAELMRAFRKELTECRHIVIKDVYRRVADSPCSRFWVTEERATIVIGEMMNGCFHCIGKMKTEMYREIFSRVRKLREERPHLDLFTTVSMVVRSPAPKFYITPSQVRSIIGCIRFSKSRPR